MRNYILSSLHFIYDKVKFSKLKRAVIIVLLFLLHSSVNAQWTQTSGPEGGEARCVAKVGDEIWVATRFGIYTSTDEGASWDIHPLFTFVNCHDIFVSGDSVLVVFTISSVDEISYKCKSSYDAGSTWNLETIIYSDWSSSGDVGKIHKSGNSVFLTETWPDDYVSHDFGNTWEIFTIPLNGFPDIVCFGESAVIINFYDTNINSYVYYIQDQTSQTLTLLDSVYYPVPIEGEILIYDQSVFFVIQYQVDTSFNYAIIRTNDNGQTWDTLSTFLYPDFIEVSIMAYNNLLYMSYYTSDQVKHWMLSTDNGASWQNGIIPAVVMSGSNSVELSTGEALSATYEGMRRYNTTCTSWFPVNTGFKAQQTLLFENNGFLYSSCNNSNFRSVDAGATWDLLPFPIYRADDYVFLGDTILTIIGSSSILMRSFNNGTSWDTISIQFNLGQSGLFAIEELNGRIYLNGQDSIFYSDNFGISWQSIAPWLDTDGNQANGVIRKSNNELFCISMSGSVAKLNPQSLTWTVLTGFWSPGVNYNTLYSVDQTIIASGNQFFKYSIDGGITWVSPVLNGIPLDSYGDPYPPRDVTSSQGLWFCTMGRYGVFVTSDMGENWLQLQDPPPFSANGGLVFQNNILFSGSVSSSVWRRSGSLSIITGNVYCDLNNNGVKDGTDYDLSGMSVKTNPQTFLATSNVAGNFGLYTDVIGDSLKLVLPSEYCTSNPPMYLTNGVASNQNFGLYIDPAIKDLSVDLTNVDVFRPGFETTLRLTAKNKGGSDASAEVKLVLDSTLTYLNAQPAYDSQQGDTLIWNSPSLSFLESSTISVHIYTPISGSLGDTVRCFASISPIIEDVVPNDNYYTLSDIIVGSYDPNYKTCSSGEFITLEQVASEELLYTVRFQNTGNFMADNVHISDTLSNFLDLNTFRVISSSHDMRFDLSGTGIVDFNFDDIFLADSTSNEAMSHGFVKYGVKCKPNLSLGNAITNTAYIYFDFNPAIITNKTTTLVTYPIILTTENIHTAITENALIVYPNPANDYFTIDARGIDSKNLSVSLFDLRGLLLRTERMNPIQNISLENLPAGIYIGVINDENNYSKRSFKIVHQ